MTLKQIHIIILALLGSLVGVACLFPELFLFNNANFVWAHDPEAPMHNVFSLISQWTHGGIALFDRFDQFNYVYTQMTSGMYTVANVILAAFYILISPFLSAPGESFHQIYGIGFHALTILLRTLGGYLLLRRLGLSPLPMILSLILLNTTLSLPMYFGLLTNNLYSYLPLVMYFTFAFFEKFGLKDLLGLVLTLTVAVANSPLYGVGYFYMVAHFFIISCLVFSLVTGSWRAIGGLKGQIKNERRSIILALVVIALIMLPWAWMFKLLGSDFFIPGSGMGQTSGRLNNMLNPLKYFDPANYHAVLGLQGFVPGILDFKNNQWDYNWPFVGWAAVLFAVIGLLFSKHRFKWAFAGALLLIVLVNSPVKMFSILSLAHWVNVLTNPFSFLLRSFHMPALLLPVLFFPLTALGMQVVWDFLQTRWKTAGAIVLIVLCGADLGLASVYAKNYPSPSNKTISPQVRPALAGMRPLFLDYQNPLHLPFREYIRAQPVPTPDPQLNSNQNLYGLFYKYAPFERHFVEPNIYAPLPVAYKSFFEDKDESGNNFAQYYLNQDPRFAFLADAAVDTKLLPWTVLLGARLDRKIALAEGVLETTPYVLQNPQAYVPSNGMIPERQAHFSFDFSQAKKQSKHGFTIYSWPLPKGFPSYVATGVFTKDIENVRLEINGQLLFPVQGGIIHAMEFDVNNIHQGRLMASLPKDVSIENMTAALSLKQSGEILNIWKNEHDKLGMDYLAAHNGWVVIHLPYDARWRITIDGKKADFFKTNKYFIGIPVTAGEHKVLLEYWPGSPMRLLIAVSVALTLAVLVFVLVFALRRQV
jgi:hypothetical protein